MKVKNRLRRVKHLCYKYHPPFHEWMLNHPEIKIPTFEDMLESEYSNKEYKELIRLLMYHFKSEIDAKYFWIGIQNQKRINKGIYTLKPIQPKQDNKNTTVGSGGSNDNKIRFPKRKRKTAWKRFVKLFPRFKNLLK